MHWLPWFLEWHKLGFEIAVQIVMFFVWSSIFHHHHRPDRCRNWITRRGPLAGKDSSITTGRRSRIALMRSDGIDTRMRRDTGNGNGTSTNHLTGIINTFSWVIFNLSLCGLQQRLYRGPRGSCANKFDSSYRVVYFSYNKMQACTWYVWYDIWRF